MDASAVHRPGSQSVPVIGLTEEAVAYYRELVEAGLTYFIAGVYGDDRETVRLLAERVVPALAG